MALLNNNNYYLTNCHSVKMTDLPNSGFLETDNNGIIVPSQYNKFSVFPKSWSIFANQLIDLPVNLTADPDQFFGFYTEPDLDSSDTYSTQVDINISAGFYNLFVLCYLPLGYGGVVILTIGSQQFEVLITGQPNGNNIIRSSNALEIPTSGQYFGLLTINKPLGLTQVWLSSYNPPLMAIQESKNESNDVSKTESNNVINPFNSSQVINRIYL